MQTYFSTSRLLLTIIFYLLSLATPAQTKEVLTNKTVVDLHKAGLSDKLILSKIEATPGTFDVSATAIIALSKQGISDLLIEAMVTKNAAKAGAQNAVVQSAVIKTEAKTLPAEASPQVPVLDFINLPHHYNKTTSALIALERSTVAVKAKINILKAMIPGTSVPILFKMDSTHSPIRFAVQEQQSFMVNTGANIPEIFGLYRMVSGKNKREATWFNVSAFENKSDKDVIAFNYRKVKEGIYEMVPVNKLEKGEYCFVNKVSYGTYGGAKADVFAFGIE